MKFDSNTILLILVTLLVAAGAYWYFFTDTGNQPPLTVTTGEQGNPAQTQFKTLVSELGPISFNTDIFSDPNFAALVDLATPIAPELSGRPDPFGAISAASQAPVATTSVKKK